MDDEPTAWLHIKSQTRWHGEAEIIGTRHALQTLADAIHTALESGKSEIEAFASDGEGYELRIRRTRTVDGLGKPFYVDEIARRFADSEFTFLKSHYRLLKTQNKEALEALKWCRANGNPHDTPPPERTA